MQLSARRGVYNKPNGVNGDAPSRERFRGHHRIAVAGFLAVTHQDDHALLGVGREIVRGLSERIGDRRVALRFCAIHHRRDRAATGARRAVVLGDVTY